MGYPRLRLFRRIIKRQPSCVHRAATAYQHAGQTVTGLSGRKPKLNKLM
jgi:hypothetical protein